MSRLSFTEMLHKRTNQGCQICVGLDVGRREQIPDYYRGPVPDFNRAIIAATHQQVGAYKINPAFYPTQTRYEVISDTIRAIRDSAPEVPIIYDAKYGDVPHTNEQWAAEAFDELGVDAITVNPYCGLQALEPFFRRCDKGVFVVCQSSNQGAGEFQWLETLEPGGEELGQLNQLVAKRVSQRNINGNLGLVVSGTDAAEICQIRLLVGDALPLLIPGIGAQGGSVERSATAAGRNCLLAISRGIILADDPQAALIEFQRAALRSFTVPLAK